MGKYLKHEDGRIVEDQGIDSSAGSADADKLIKTDTDGLLDESFLPAGVGADLRNIEADETLDARDMVNVFNDSGTPKVRKADATEAGKEVHGYVKDGVSAAATAEVFFSGVITGLTGLTPGARQYMSTTAGDLTETAPSASGNIVQKVGVAVASDAMVFSPQEPIELI